MGKRYSLPTSIFGDSFPELLLFILSPHATLIVVVLGGDAQLNLMASH
jgi:hypothetical protein